VRIPPLETALTILLAFGFASVGEIALGRRTGRDVFGWNESFLVGMGACAAALFPLSLLWPSGGVRLTLVGMAGAAIFRLVRRTPAPTAPTRSGHGPHDPLAIAGVVLVALSAASFVALNFRYNYLWDGFQIWAARASVLFHEGGMTRWWFPEETYDDRLLTYPPLVPMFEALVSVLRGGFEFDVFKPIFPLFFVSLLLSTYSAARSGAGTRGALAATLLVALLPSLSTSYAAGAYADMPQAAFVAGAAAATLRRSRAAPWLIGALTTVKSEGTILTLLFVAAVLFCWLVSDGRRFGSRLTAQARAAVIVAAFLAIRIGYLRWLGIRDVVYGPFDAAHLAAAAHRARTVARLCAEALLRPKDWGLFWPAFFAAAAVLLIRGDERERSLALFTAAAVAVTAVPFLFTTWDIALQIAQAYFRLLAQIAPAAAAAIAIGYRRAWESSSTPAPHA
jgi:hypothetical protein